jgi:hypothetical protein
MENSDLQKFLQDWSRLALNGSVTVFCISGRPVKIQCEGFKALVSPQELAAMERSARDRLGGELSRPEGKESP